MTDRVWADAFNAMTEKMLSFHNITIEELKNDPEWRQKYKISKEQYDEFHKYARDMLRRETKSSWAKIDAELAYFELTYLFLCDDVDAGNKPDDKKNVLG